MTTFDCSAWDNEFMVPEIREDRNILMIDTVDGITVLPCDLLGMPDPPPSDCGPDEAEAWITEVNKYVNGINDPEGLFEPVKGYVVRLHAPGFSDCTPWEYCEDADDVRSWLQANEPEA